MEREIERKFLVRSTSCLDGMQGERIVQGYIAREAGAMTVRVRIRGERAVVTMKGSREGIARDEFEYPIPLSDAESMIARHCAGRGVRKTRFLVPYGGHLFEVDVFDGRHAGLVLAEVELPRADTPLNLPDWVGDEVSHDLRYRNAFLAQFEGGVRSLGGWMGVRAAPQRRVVRDPGWSVTG